MDGGVTACRPAGAHGQEGPVIGFSDEHLGGISLHLRMASEAEIGVSLGEHLVVDGAVRLVAGRAAVLHAFVDENKGTRLLTMTLSALLILAS